jgi:hypothetical protein
MNLDFSLDMFKSAFIHLIHLSNEGLSSMVFKHHRNIFDPKESTNIFSQLFLVCTYVATRHILNSIARALGASRLLILAKPSSGIWPIVVGLCSLSIGE